MHTRCVPPPPATTLRQRIDQMRRGPQTPSQTDPKGNSAGQNLALSHVLRLAAAQSDPRSHGMATPTLSTQDGGSQMFTPVAPSSVSTQPYSNAPSQQHSTLLHSACPKADRSLLICTRMRMSCTSATECLNGVTPQYNIPYADSVISAQRPASSSRAAAGSSGAVQAAKRPRLPWVQRLKADLQAAPITGELPTNLLHSTPTGGILSALRLIHAQLVFCCVSEWKETT